MKNYSQLGQDLFVLSAAKNKTYIEVGAWKPEHYSNTFLLESEGWKGFSVELNETKKPLWDNHPTRKNSIYWADALFFDYNKALADQGLSTHIGYLSCDIEPPENTFAALKLIIESGISFDCITFEHDRYQNKINYDPIATEFLLDHGYKIAVSEVYRIRRYREEGQKRKTEKICPMETWYVHRDIDFKEITYEEWTKRNAQ
jgi:hypothetical protein